MWESRRIQANGIMQHVRIAGSGLPVVMLHGWPQTSYCWRKLVPPLARRHTVIAPDLRGFGDSDKPVDGYDKRTVANDVRELLTVLGHRRAVIVGHDIGAQVAFRMALDFPELLDGLVILNGRYPGLGTALMYTPQQVPERWYYFFNQIPELPERMVAGNVEAYIGYILDHWSHPDFRFPEDDVAEYVAAFSKERALTGGFNHYRASAREDATQWAEDRGHTIDVPTLVLWGCDDPVNTPEYSDGYHRVLTDMRFRFIERCGHFPHEEKPEETARTILDFLGSA
jgi:pimeloyl-ACP methyl ester carboxylesterase